MASIYQIFHICIIMNIAMSSSGFWPSKDLEYGSPLSSNPELVNTLESHTLKGTWKLISSRKEYAFNNLATVNSLEGSLEIRIMCDVLTNKNNVTLHFIEGEYTDDNQLRIRLKNINLNMTSYLFNHEVTVETITGVRDKNPLYKRIHLYLNLSPLIDTHYPKSGYMNIKLVSNECRIPLQDDDQCTSLEISSFLEFDIEGMKNGYIFFFLCTLLAVLKIICLRKITNICEVTPYMAKKLSVTSLSLIALTDLTIVWNFIYPDYCMPFQIWNVCQFWLGFIASILPFWDLLFIIKISNIKDPHQDNYASENQAKLCSLSTLYTFVKFSCGFLIFVYATSLEYKKSNLILWFVAFFLMPQIWENALKGNLLAFDKPGLIIAYGNFFVLILYFKGFQGNICHFRPSYLFVLFLIAAIAFQIWILYMQDKKGPRFFIPKPLLRFLPKNESSVVSLNDEELEIHNEEGDVCSICLLPYQVRPPISAEMSEDLKRILKNIEKREKTILKIPCSHKFHIPCLLEWISKKSQCPVCRAVIGEII